MSTLSIDLVDWYGYQIPSDTSIKSKEVIQTLAECGCVEVLFKDKSGIEINEILKFASDYAITVYKGDNSFILCDNPVRKRI